METIKINKEILKEIIKESFFEIIQEERINFYQNIIPFVNKKEMSQIESIYRSPENYDKNDFSDMTVWIKK